MKIFFVCVCVAMTQLSTAQKVIDVSKNPAFVGSDVFFSVGGQPFVTVKFVNLVEGSPYFKDEWLQSQIVMPDGTQYRGVSVKLDLVDQELHYLNLKKEEMITTVPIREIMIMDTAGKTYGFIHSSFMPQAAKPIKPGWYLVLSNDATPLYKMFTKVVSENKPYGSATVEQRMRTTETYIVYALDGYHEIKKIKDAPSAFPEKKSELETFLKNKDDKALSMDQRLIALVDYYDSLTKK
jgi:hypothetical protein